MPYLLPLLALSPFFPQPVSPQGWKQLQPKEIPGELRPGYRRVMSLINLRVQRVAVGWQTPEYARRKSGRRVLGLECKDQKTGEIYLIMLAERSDQPPQLALNRALAMGVVPQPRTEPHGVNAFGRWTEFDYGVIGHDRAVALINRLGKMLPGTT